MSCAKIALRSSRNSVDANMPLMRVSRAESRQTKRRMQRQSSLVLAGNEKIFRGPKTLRVVAQALPLARGLAKKHQKCANFAHQDSKGYICYNSQNAKIEIPIQTRWTTFRTKKPRGSPGSETGNISPGFTRPEEYLVQCRPRIMQI